MNHQGAAHLAAAAVAVDIPLLHVSTDYVFDGSKEGAYTPEDATNPLGVYGASKLAGEQAIVASGCRYLIVRTAWVFSEYGNNFVKTMLRLGAERDELSIVADQVGSPTYAGDLADLLIKAAEKMVVGDSVLENKIAHFGGSPACSWYEFAESIFDVALESQKILKKPALNKLTSKQYPTLAERPLSSVLDSSELLQFYNIDSNTWLLGLRRVMQFI